MRSPSVGELAKRGRSPSRKRHEGGPNARPGAKCVAGLVAGQPAAFTAVLSFPHPVKPAWREHRTVCLPDFQGVRIGNAMSEYVASLFRSTGKLGRT